MGDPAAVLRFHNTEVHALAFLESPCGLLLVSGALDGRIAIWDVLHHTLIFEFVAHGGGVLSLHSWRPLSFWSQGRDGRVFRWMLSYDAESGQLSLPAQAAAMHVCFGSFCKADVWEEHTSLEEDYGALAGVLFSSSASHRAFVCAPTIDGSSLEVWRVDAPASTPTTPVNDGSNSLCDEVTLAASQLEVPLAVLDQAAALHAAADAASRDTTKAEMKRGGASDAAVTHAADQAASRSAVAGKQASTTGSPMCIKLISVPRDWLPVAAAPPRGLHGFGSAHTSAAPPIDQGDLGSADPTGTLLHRQFTAGIRHSVAQDAAIATPVTAVGGGGGGISDAENGSSSRVDEHSTPLQLMEPAAEEGGIGASLRRAAAVASNSSSLLTANTNVAADDHSSGDRAAPIAGTLGRPRSGDLVLVAAYENGWLYALHTGCSTFDDACGSSASIYDAGAAAPFAPSTSPSSLSALKLQNDGMSSAAANVGVCLAALCVSHEPLLTVVLLGREAEVETRAPSHRGSLPCSTDALTATAAATAAASSARLLVRGVAGGAGGFLYCFALDLSSDVLHRSSQPTDLGLGVGGSGWVTHVIPLAVPGVSVSCMLPQPPMRDGWATVPDRHGGRDCVGATLSLSGGAPHGPPLDNCEGKPLPLRPSAYSRMALTGGWDHCVRAIDGLTGACAARLDWHGTSVYALAAALAPTGTAGGNGRQVGDVAAGNNDDDKDDDDDDDPFSVRPGASKWGAAPPALGYMKGHREIEAAALHGAYSDHAAGSKPVRYCVATASKDGRVALWGVEL